VLSRTVVHASLERMSSSILISEVRIPRAEARCADTTRRSLTIFTTDVERASEAPTSNDEPASLRQVFEGNPKLRAAWRNAHEYRKTFAPPEEAKAAAVLLGDLNRMDALFFGASRRSCGVHANGSAIGSGSVCFSGAGDGEFSDEGEAAAQRRGATRSAARPKQPAGCASRVRH
jgi:hypothetical protein